MQLHGQLQLAEQWLKEVNPQIDFDKIKNVFLNHNKSYSHSRHLSKQDCKNVGLNIVDLEQTLIYKMLFLVCIIAI